jgi:hypothetical protein
MMAGINVKAVVLFLCVLTLLSISLSVSAVDGENKDGLVLHLDFNEGSGNIAHDRSGNNNHVELHGPSWKVCVNGSALDFNGINDYAVKTNASGLDFNATDEMTIAAWFRLDGHSGQDGILSINGDDCCVYRIMVDSDMHPVYDAGEHKDQAISDYVFIQGVWYHYVLTARGGGNAVVYINGKQVRSSSAGVPERLPEGMEFFVGCGEVNWLHHTEGRIDEIRVYDRVLSEEEVVSLYGESKPPCAERGLASKAYYALTTVISEAPPSFIPIANELYSFITTLDYLRIFITVVVVSTAGLLLRRLSKWPPKTIRLLDWRFKLNVRDWFKILERRPFLLMVPVVLCQVYILSWFAGDGFILDTDAEVHAMRVVFTMDAMRHLRVDGWFPYWYNGFQLYQFYAPMMFFLCSTLYMLFLGKVQLATVFKLFLLLAYIGQAVFIYACMRLFKYRVFTSLTAAAFSLSAHYFIGLGVNGLLSQVIESAAAVLIPLVIGLSYRALREGGMYTPLAGVMLGVVMLSHVLQGFFSFIAVATLFVVEFACERKRAVVYRFIAVFSVGFLLSVLWTIPTLYRVNEKGLDGGSGDVEFVKTLTPVLSGSLVGDKAMVYLGLAGILASAFVVMFRRDSRPLYFLSLLLVAIILAFRYINPQQLDLNPHLVKVLAMATGIFYNRGIMFIALLLPIFAGIAVDTLLSLSERLAGRHRPMAYRVIAGVLIYLFVAYTVPDPMKFHQPLEADKPGFIYVRDFADYLRANTPEASLIGVEITKDYDFDSLNLQKHINLFSKRPVFVGFFTEGTLSYMGRPEVLKNLGSGSAADAAGRLHRYGIDYLVMTKPETIEKLNGTDYFTLAYSNGNISLWKVNPPNSGVRTVNKSIDFNRYAFTVESDGNGTFVIPVSYKNKWFITVNDVGVPFQKTEDNLIEIHVPEGISTVSMVYTMDTVDILSYSISILTFLAVAAFVIRRLKDEGKKSR